MTRAQTWIIDTGQHPQRSLTSAAVDQRRTRQRLLGHLHVGGIDEHTVALVTTSITSSWHH
jgi:hypothetical protein